MKLIVGLGNPGEKHKHNRHNVGFMVVDELARQMVNDQWLMVKKFNSLIINHQSSIIFYKPQTFMNASGVAVKKLIAQFKVKTPDLWVIHDDLDLPLGNYKIQKGKGPREHKGLQSIYKAIGSRDFWHIRIGVDNRSPDSRTPGEDYVLQKFNDEEMAVVEKVIKEVLEKLTDMLKQ
jgi:PTH1 family peptidyl-tRNA hydrolase